MQLATNYLGHFALATGLHPALREAGSARIVVVSSGAHLTAPFDFDDPHFERRPYDPWTAYGQSKSADVLLAVSAHRWAADGITANALNPGYILTGLQRHLDDDTMRAFGVMDDEGNLTPLPYYKTPAQGAATSVLLAASPLLEGVTGRYFEDNQEARLVTDEENPTVKRRRPRRRPASGGPPLGVRDGRPPHPLTDQARVPPSSEPRERDRPPRQQPGGLRVVGRQRAVREKVPVPGVQEQFGGRGLRDQRAGGVGVLGEEGVVLHRVHLYRHLLGPGRTELGHRDAGVHQQRAPRPGPCLRQLLRGQRPEREAGVDDVPGRGKPRAHPRGDLTEAACPANSAPSSSESKVRPSNRSGV